MKSGLLASLGLPDISDDSSKKQQQIMFNCWANTSSTGTYNGIVDATPGLLHVIPYDNEKNYENITPPMVEQILQNSSKYVIFPFSIIGTGKPRAIKQIPGDIGIILDSIIPISWPYTTKDTVLNTLDTFDFDSVMHDVYNTGPVSVVVNSSKKLLTGTCDIINIIKDKFIYSQALYMNVNKLNNKDLSKYGNAEFRMSFFKPSQCIPFFSNNHGGVIHLTITQPKYSAVVGKFTPLIEMVGLFTDNVKAFNNIDGTGNMYGTRTPFKKIQEIFNEYTAAFSCVGGAATATK